MRMLVLLLLLAPAAFGQSRAWFLVPLVNGDVRLDSLAYETGDPKNPLAGGVSVAHLNWKDSTALVLVHSSDARITALKKSLPCVGSDTVAVKDSTVIQDGKAVLLIDSKTATALPKDLSKVTLQQVANCYKLSAVTIGKVSVGVKATAVVKELPKELPIEVKR
jgi:hypothetical protein